MFRGVKSVDSSSLPDRGCFPGADGSTIESTSGFNASAIRLYGVDGSTELTEDGTGYSKVNITTSGVLNDNTSLVYSIKHPLTFVFNSVDPWDWYTNTSNHNDTLWGDDTNKSNFDPCPTGWRIPTGSIWNDFTRTTDSAQPLNGTFPNYVMGTVNELGGKNECNPSNGRLYKGLAWYPESGWLSKLDGRFRDVGYTGGCWNSLSNEIGGNILNFHLQLLVPLHSLSRAYGFPVRCIQE